MIELLLFVLVITIAIWIHGLQKKRERMLPAEDQRKEPMPWVLSRADERRKENPEWFDTSLSRMVCPACMNFPVRWESSENNKLFRFYCTRCHLYLEKETLTHAERPTFG